jgi:hypothetical protein
MVTTFGYLSPDEPPQETMNNTTTPAIAKDNNRLKLIILLRKIIYQRINPARTERCSASFRS